MNDDIPADEVRRQARQSQVEHVTAMRTMRDIVARLFGGDDGDTHETDQAKADFLTNGLGRRRFLLLGGTTVATAAIFAACGSDDGDKSAATKAGDDKSKSDGEDGNGKTSDRNDITILRTAASIELLAVDVYQKAIDSGFVKTPAVADAAKLFQAQHKDHADLFNGATKAAGGKTFDQPNPVVMQSLQGPLGQLHDENGVVALALQLENAATATYLSSVGLFKDRTLNRAAMSVGGVEARHAAVLAGVLRQPQVPKAFFTKDGAVAPGTGV
jgi:hypothetical protein